MDPFKLYLVLYVVCVIIDAIYTIEQHFYENIKNCSSSRHIQARDVVVDQMVLPFVKCFKTCSEHPKCGATMYDKSDSMCYLVDKDYLICDEDIGVYEMVS